MTKDPSSPEFPFQPVQQALETYLPDFDHQVVEILLATVVANWTDGPPVWLELIAPASLGKTTILEPLARVKGAEILSSLTSHTLLSGSSNKDGHDPSMLTRLGKRPFIIIKELSTLLQSDPWGRGEIFAQLREVFDGNISKTFGTGAKRSWKGKALVLAGITPQVDKYTSLETALGERFVRLRFESSVDPEALALAAWNTVGEELNTEEALHVAYKYCVEEGIKNVKNVSLSAESLRRLAALASYTAATRTHVDRNKYRKDRIEQPPATEGTPRLMKNFGLLAQGLCAIHGQTDLTDTMIPALRRIAEDSMPEPRRSILQRIVSKNTKGDWPRAKDLNGVVSDKYVYQILEDLEVLQVLKKREAASEGRGRPPQEYHLSDKMIGYAQRAHIMPN